MQRRPSIHDALSNLAGKPTWKPRRDVGSMFFLDIGDPLVRPGQMKPHGEWHFLFECCHWRFETSGEVLVGSEDDQQFIDGVFEGLNLDSVGSAEVADPSRDLLIKFSSGVVFRTFSTSAEATNQWTQWLLIGPEEDLAWVSDGGGNVKCIARDEPVR